MNQLLKYMFLPREISAFEQGYLARLNKVALAFFCAHIVGIPAVAWACGTGVLQALVLTGFVLVGTVAGYLMLSNPRHRSMMFGATAMLIGALLVHFGRGPVQIEMHFYFFALLAMLCMFANPTVNITAAVTVALHHALGWWLIPASLFNYDAAWWVVAVHAAFVVMETVACCFISRTFFDNVMGLEKIVEARTRDLARQKQGMQLVLDSVQEGLVVINYQGELRGANSLALETWFGSRPQSGSFADWVATVSPKFADMTALGLEMLDDGFMPLEVTLAQMPKRLEAQGRYLEFSYSPASDETNCEAQVLVVVRDVTAAVAAEQEGRRHADLLATFRHIMRDKVAFLEFLAEAEKIIGTLKNAEFADLAHFKRLVHTIKGNAAVFGMHLVASAADRLESVVIEQDELPSDEQIASLFDAWDSARKDLEQLLDDGETQSIAVDDHEYQQLLRAVLDDSIDRRIVAAMVRSWRLEPTRARFERFAEQMQRIARRLSKDGLEVAIEDNDVRLDRERFAPFWGAMVHVLRNAVDHGIESPEERGRQGKAEHGSIQLEARAVGQELVLAIEDDGAGIQVDRLRSKARAAGLPDAEELTLEELVFADGLSSRDEATEVSGRGVGMAAVREACEAIGGYIIVRTTPGQGTRFEFRFPVSDESMYPGHEASLQRTAAA